MRSLAIIFIAFGVLPPKISARILSINDFGAIPDSAVGISTPRFPEFGDAPGEYNKDSPQDLSQICRINTRAFNHALKAAQPGDTVQVPDGSSYHFTGGVRAYDLHNVTIDIAGSLHFVHNQTNWPFHNTSHYFEYRPAIYVGDSSNITLTSSTLHAPTVKVDNYRVTMDQSTGSGGLINGYGKIWWDEAILGRLPNKDGDTRPRLIHVESSADVLVEKLTLVNSPYWTLTVEAVGAEIHHVNVLVDRQYQAQLLGKIADSRRLSDSQLDFPFPNDIPDWVGRRIHQPQDLNTDGIDPRGVNIYVHDCIIQNADDSVAVKPPIHGNRTTALHGTLRYNCTQNVTIENMVLTGFGASIGSVGPTKTHACVDNVVFRNISMPETGKGIYIKSDASDCTGGNSSQITNILYQDVYMYKPFWWAIWIGPQQQHEPHADSIGKCPLSYPLPGSRYCPTQGCTTFENITLRNVLIDDPFISPGVIMGNESNPITGLFWDNVTVRGSSWKFWHGKWPFHESGYPFPGTYQCIHALGECKNCSPTPHCLDSAP